jgi:hypothetical protein
MGHGNLQERRVMENALAFLSSYLAQKQCFETHGVARCDGRPRKSTVEFGIRCTSPTDV